MPYKPKTKFELKDTLPQDDPRKVIYGREFAVEFEAISATFADVQGGLVGKDVAPRVTFLSVCAIDNLPQHRASASAPPLFFRSFTLPSG